ncbi:MAG: ABC transporter ATP-binding protein [Thermoanaerobaculia bacterium]
MSSIAVRADRVSKTYRLFSSPGARLLAALVPGIDGREFRALADVSFEVERGGALALVGENGAGKSTLLKLIAGVSEPSSGSIAVDGRVAAILELGSGFHPEFSGRENARLNAALLGLDEAEVERRLPEILAWSELGDFLDQPVRQYSSGMAMRLGFAIATQVDPDLLIVDEALSVGDGYFQKKCMDRILEFVERGKTLLFCSHAMYYISEFCERALWLRNGEVAALGPTDEVVRDYERYLIARRSTSTPAVEIAAPAAEPEDRRPARLVAVELLGASGDLPVYRHGETFAVDVRWESEDRNLAFQVAVGINREDDLPVASFATHYSGLAPWTGAMSYGVRLEIPRLPIAKGHFGLAVFLLDEGGLHVYDRKLLREAFAVSASRYLPGLVEIDHRWVIDREG